MQPTFLQCLCGKRGWLSINMARKACSRAGNRLRIYQCATRLYHTTHAERRSNKGRSTRQQRAKRRYENRSERRNSKRDLDEGL